MNTFDERALSSLARSIERMTVKERARAVELARRTKALAEKSTSRRRTWRETKSEILGLRE